MTSAATRLARVEATLRSNESEGHMEPERITAAIGPLYERLFPLLDPAGVRLSGPGIACYEDDPAGRGRDHRACRGGGLRPGGPAG